VNEKKAIIIDLDGTLFTSKKIITDFNISKVNECLDQGHVVIIATARPLRTVVNRFPEHFKPSYIVLCNGAWITRHNNVIHRDEIKGEDVKKICCKLEQYGYKPMIEANDAFFADGDRESWFEGEIYPFNQYGTIDACKILAYKADGIDGAEIHRVISDDFTKVITDKGTLLQISKKNCTKLSACEEILKLEQISWKNTFAFGDDNNDIPVFGKAGFPIAMKNATEELLKLSKWITESNDNDGVGIAIDKFILMNTSVPLI
jgi:Cof subfamily protein (haloacid dehalogenase superfamily)